MISFFAGAFAVAGAVAASGPVIIHMLNRRRFRVVHWAAMDFLREAMRRSRRILQIRDLLLLLLRTACLLLFGLAMARPYLSHTGQASGVDQPVHAVLVVDNSLSMGYQRLNGTLLDEAKTKTHQFIDRLPQGSQISILPLCGAATQFSWDPYRTKDDALEALASIHVVDRQGSAAQAIDLAKEACRRGTDLASKRVAFISDQQGINWPTGSRTSQLKEVPDLQVVQVAADKPENAWVADFKLQDGIADVETPTTFLATIRYEGQSPRHDVQVTLAVDGVPAASQTIDLEPGQSREVSFPYRFDVAAEPGRAVFSTAVVSIPADRLAADDERVLAVPVVAALPVVFVDQFGEDEDPSQNRYGETFRLRRLLAPVTTRGDYGRQLIQVRHVKIDELNRELLQDARLVVIAGVESPGASVPVLREYLEQGGQLLIATGGDFDPVAWNNLGWLKGAGILPAPLEPDFVGVRPDEAPDKVKPFFLDVTTMVHDYFRIANTGDQELADLYRQPIFFKTVASDVRPDKVQELVSEETQRITKQRAAAELAREAASKNADKSLPTAAALPPGANWLLWVDHDAGQDKDLSPQDLAERSQPHVLAAFTNHVPFLIDRSIGRGDVIFAASSIQSDWNTLTTTNAVLVFDRILRSMLQTTIPQRNLATIDETIVPVEPQQRQNRFTLSRPGHPDEPLSIDALGGDAYGLAINNLSDRGIYSVVAQRADASADPQADSKLWEIDLAVNGPALESDLTPLDKAALEERVPGTNVRWVAGNEPISLEGALVRGQDTWRWLMACVLACLLLEIVVLAWPKLARRDAA